MLAQLRPFKTKLFDEITEIPAVLKPAHLTGLDGLRGISIIIVLLSHIFRFTYTGTFFYGEVGVHIFFVISGFLITTILLKEKVIYGKVSLKNFYLRRTLRIFPVAYLFLVVVLILNSVFHLDIKAKSFLAAFFYFKNVPSQNISEWYTGHFWTLSIEEQYYLLAPALLVISPNKFLKAAFAFIFLVLFLEFVVFTKIVDPLPQTFLYKAVYGIINLFGKGTVSILIGSISSILIFKKIITTQNLKAGYYVTFILFIAAVIIFTYSSHYIIDMFVPEAFAIIIAVIIIINLNTTNLMTVILDNKALKFIGVLSYSLYVWQEIFTYNQPWQHAFKYSDSILLNLIALSIVACLSYFFYEKPILKLKDKFLPKSLLVMK